MKPLKQLLESMFLIATNKKELQGVHFSDEFWRKIRRYHKVENASMDASAVYLEVKGIASRLFQHEDPERAFKLSSKNKKLETLFHNYFLGGHPSRSIYGEMRLTAWFERIAYNLLLHNKSYFAIKWDIVDSGDTNELIFPISLHPLSSETIFELSFLKTKYYLQLYNPFTILFENDLIYRNRLFQNNEVVEFKLPGQSLVKESLKYVKAKKSFYEFGILKQRAFLEPDNLDIALQKARYKQYDEKRKEHEIAIGHISRIFSYKELMNETFSTTDYYRAYIAVRNAKFLNTLRELLVNVFQSEVIDEVRAKNNIVEPVEITLNNDLFVDNTLVDKYYEQYKQGEISYDKLFMSIYDLKK